MIRRVDLTGKTFGRWTVLAKAGLTTTWNEPLVLARCACGTTRVVHAKNLRRGLSRSCGCWKREVSSQRHVKHGCSGWSLARRGRKPTREYQAWQDAKKRCFTPTVKQWQDYGGRGITMCAEWRDSFAAFLRDMGECPFGRQLDRINNDGNYQPGNCRWATRSQQARNRRRRTDGRRTDTATADAR